MWTVNEVQNYTALKRRFFIVDRWEISTEKNQMCEATKAHNELMEPPLTCIGLTEPPPAFQLMEPALHWLLSS